MTQQDNRASFNYWRPAELAALVIAFIIFWPLGLVVLAWKYWNDRSRSPRNLDDVITEGFGKLRDGVRATFGETGTSDEAFAPTGNASFDAHIRTELQRIESDRNRLADEVRAFREFVEQERSGGADLYERFRNRYGSGAA